MDIATIAALVAIITATFALIRFLLKAYGFRLSKEEIEILKACAQKGELRLFEVNGHASWIRADEKDFFDQQDPAYTSRYTEAFEKILSRGLARHEAGLLYRLTGSGFEIARKQK